MKAHFIIRIFNTLRICHRLSKHDQVIRLLQITDTHLFADSHAHLLGVNTSASFLSVLDNIQDKGISFDGIITTGDISQDHSAASYQFFVDGISRWQQPCYWLPGNHDYQQAMAEVLDQSTLIRCDQALLGEHWQLIMLDSQVEGSAHGFLSQDQSRLLTAALSAEPKRHALVLLHHHPFPVGSAWIDKHKLKNDDEFWGWVQKSDQIKGVVCGHIHQDLDREYNGCRVLAAPSTCIQFLPNSAHFTLDPNNPGWREIFLHPDGTISTQIGRIDGAEFQPDMTSSGY